MKKKIIIIISIILLLLALPKFFNYIGKCAERDATEFYNFGGIVAESKYSAPYYRAEEEYTKYTDGSQNIYIGYHAGYSASGGYHTTVNEGEKDDKTN